MQYCMQAARLPATFVGKEFQRNSNTRLVAEGKAPRLIGYLTSAWQSQADGCYLAKLNSTVKRQRREFSATNCTTLLVLRRELKFPVTNYSL